MEKHPNMTGTGGMSTSSQIDYIAPQNCQKCKRLAAFIQEQKQAHPRWHNGPVPSFGPIDAQILVLGLAPGLKGANATGRPFTGDYAGQVLYQALSKFGYCKGAYQAHAQDGIKLVNLRISNAVRCVPPQNKPTPSEISNCRDYLTQELQQMTQLKVIFTLGRIAHDTCLTHFKLRKSDYPFAHNSAYRLPNGVMLVSSYHCSRYNIQTNRLSIEMFDDVVSRLSGFC